MWEVYEKLCAEKGVSSYTFSKETRISQSTIYNWKIRNNLIGAFKYRFDRQYTTHTTHDCRHSFATYAYKCRMDATMVKLIMGHEVGDITKGRYTHITAEELTVEMKKYKIE